MAFFGLTMLGPQCAFRDVSSKQTRMRIFDVSEFDEAFRKVEGTEGAGIPASDVAKVLELVYHGPLPRADAALCAEFFPRDDRFTVESFLKAVQCVLFFRRHSS